MFILKDHCGSGLRMVLSTCEKRCKLGHGGRQVVMGSGKGETGVQSRPQGSVTRRSSSMVVVARDLVLKVIMLWLQYPGFGPRPEEVPHTTDKENLALAWWCDALSSQVMFTALAC